jgi:hypothetical protein
VGSSCSAIQKRLILEPRSAEKTNVLTAVDIRDFFSGLCSFLRPLDGEFCGVFFDGNSLEFERSHGDSSVSFIFIPDPGSRSFDRSKSSVAHKPLWLPASSSVCSLLILFSESLESSPYGTPALYCYTCSKKIYIKKLRRAACVLNNKTFDDLLNNPRNTSSGGSQHFHNGTMLVQLAARCFLQRPVSDVH